MTEIQIKMLLVQYLKNQYKNFVVGSEFTFHFGERRADLALLESDFLTAFEIKGARDNVLRLAEQIKSYKNFFDYCYVVCEDINLESVRSVISKDIGIMIARSDGIFPIRRSKQFKRHNKVILTSNLSVQKLKILAKNNELKSKHSLTEYVSRKNSIQVIRELSRKDFDEKYSVASKLMLQETTQHLNSDDIYTITKRAPSDLKRKCFT